MTIDDIAIKIIRNITNLSSKDIFPQLQFSDISIVLSVQSLYQHFHHNLAQ